MSYSRSLSTLFMAFAVSISIASEVDEAILQKRIGGGNTAPGVNIAEECNIFLGSVTFKGPGMPRSVEMPLAFTEKVKDTVEIRKLTVMAKAGKPETTQGPTDGPTTQYLALLKENVGPSRRIMLRQKGPVQIENSATEAKEKLIELIDRNCNPKAEVVALFSSNLYSLRLEDARKKAPDGFFVTATSVEVKKSGGASLVYVYLTRTNKREAKDHDDFGAIIGTIKSTGTAKKPQYEVQKSVYDDKARPKSE